MKKLFCMLLLTGLFFLLPAAARGETIIGSDDTLTAILNQYRDAGASSFEIQLRTDYFDEIRDNQFAKLNVLTLKCGMQSKQMKYTYDGTLLFSQVRWEQPSAAECASAQEIQAAMDLFLGEGMTSFQIICPQELSDSMETSILYAWMGLRGVEEFKLEYTFSYPKIYYFSSIKSYSIPYAVAQDDDAFTNAIEYMWRKKTDHFYIVMGPEYYNEFRNDTQRLDLLAKASRMDSWRYSSDYYFDRFEFVNVKYTDEPCTLCETEEEVKEAVRQMGAAEVRDFRLVLPNDLYSRLQANSFALLQRLTAEAGMVSSNMQYSIGGNTIYYSNAVIKSDMVRLTTAGEAMAYASECAAKGDMQISLYCTQELYDLLIGGISPYAIARDEMAPLYDVTAQAGIFDYTFTYSAATGIINISIRSYYPGTNIIRAVRSGDASALTRREMETMTEASRLAAELRADTPTETARNIHDWLCRKITYTTDDSTDEDDTATGAILNGKANCDGYSDAFYLIGTLAGLNVRYQHGDSYQTGRMSSLFNEVTHMWNLLEIDGSWRLVDVTWDDSDEGISYTWFNIGEDRASRMHIWNRETSVPLLAETDLYTRPANEYVIRKAEDAAAAMQDITARGYDSFVFFYQDVQTDTHQNDLNTVSQFSTQSYIYSWNERMRTLSVFEFSGR